MNRHCLHGFLGAPSDWLQLPFNLEPSSQIIATNLFQSPLLPFKEWAKKFNQNVRENEKTIKSFSKPCLIGYSLGGRLALHALLENPDMYSCAVFISTHYGLKDIGERDIRASQDEQWAHAFLKDPWEEVIKKWNNQSTLKNEIKIPLRLEKDYSRTMLAAALNTWSLGKQENLKEKLEEISIPILWCAGQQDEKFCNLSATLVLKNPYSKICIIKNAAHRVPWENTHFFLHHLDTWLNSIRHK